MENIEYEIQEIRKEQRENSQPWEVPNGEFFYDLEEEIDPKSILSK